MTDDVNDDKGKGGISAWLFEAIFHSGWRRRILFIVAVVLFLVLACALRDGVDFKGDPSALVARDATVFLETRELGALLKNAAMLPFWVDERRASGDEQWNHIQVSLAGMLGERVNGFGSQVPLSWIEGARRAALAVSAGDGPGAGYWTVFFELPSPATALRELRQEPGVTIAKLDERNENIVEIAGNDDSKLIVGAVGPWLAVSSAPDGILFAADAVRRPALTLAAAGILPKWSRDAGVRGVYYPALALSGSANQHLARLAGWIRPDSRFAFTASVDASGVERINTEHRFLGEARGGNWFWSLVKLILGLVALLCLALAVAIIAAMLGWGGWLKVAAARAGIKPAGQPFSVRPSQAFKQDTGMPADAADEAAAAEVESLDLPGGHMPLESAEGEDLEDGDEDLETEPLATFPEIQDSDLVDEAAGHLPEEEEKSAKKATKARPGRAKPAPKKAASAPRAKKAASEGDAEEPPAKPKRRASKK